MNDPGRVPWERVLEVLKDARSRVERDWWDGTCVSDGNYCALTSFGGTLLDRARFDAAELLASVMGVERPDFIPEWNDSHTHAEVLAAFDKAIDSLAPDPTPNADAALEIMAACETAGEVLARHIVAEHPQMDEREIRSLASAELFYAAQDTAQAVAHGVKFERA